MKTEEQKKIKADEFVVKLKNLCDEYGLKNISFVAEMENKYLGIVGLDVTDSFGTYFEAVINLGRLWQSCREKTKNILDGYEKTNN